MYVFRINQEKVTLADTVQERGRGQSEVVNLEKFYISAIFMEPATRIERATCGLRMA
jgi:hypothetical protein